MIKSARSVKLTTALAIEKLYNNKWDIVTELIADAIDTAAQRGKSYISVCLTSSNYPPVTEISKPSDVISCDIEVSFHSDLVKRLDELLSEKGYIVTFISKTSEDVMNTNIAICW